MIPFKLDPNINAKPNPQNNNMGITMDMRFLIATLMLFLDRVIPTSRQRKPACINNMRTEENKIQKTSTSGYGILLYLKFKSFLVIK
jgi:hypothetical protein